MKNFWKNLKRFLHFLTTVFMYSILLLLVIIFIVVIVYVVEDTKYAGTNHHMAPLLSAYVIISPSMVPTIQVKDAVIGRRTIGSEIDVGDIITFVSEDPMSYGVTITHRVVGKTQDDNGIYYFRTKGDNNNVADNWVVPEDNILGKVMFKIPKLGYVQQFLSTSYGWIIAIVIPCLGIIIYDIIKLIRTLLGFASPKKEVKNRNEKRIAIKK